MKTVWNEERLRRLYRRYNQRYWNGTLHENDLVIGKLLDAMGTYNKQDRRIVIDIESHRSDREVRSTLLHEMAHVAAGLKGRTAHGTRFFFQMERLLKQGAPLTVGFPENGGLPLLESVPRRFGHCRHALRIAVERKQREIAKKADGEVDLADELVEEFGAAGIQGLTWKQAVLAVGKNLGLLDIDARPLPFFKKLLPKASRAFWHARKLLPPSSRNPAKSSVQQWTS